MGEELEDFQGTQDARYTPDWESDSDSDGDSSSTSGEFMWRVSVYSAMCMSLNTNSYIEVGHVPSN